MNEKFNNFMWQARMWKNNTCKKLKEKSGIVHLSLDDFMLKLFGEIEDRKIFEEKLKACRDLVYEITDQLLPKVDVVFDFGFWTKEERDCLRKRFKDFNVIIVSFTHSIGFR